MANRQNRIFDAGSNGTLVNSVYISETNSLKELMNSVHESKRPVWAYFTRSGSSSIPQANSSIPAKSNSKWWQRLGNNQEEDAALEMTVDPEMRQQLLSEHIQFFNEKLLEVESDITTESESLGSIRNSLRHQRDRLETEIGTHMFEKDSLDKMQMFLQ